MPRVITFSRTFPSYHPKVGQPTFFVEKFWNSIYEGKDREEALISHELSGMWSAWCEMRELAPKHTTIRAGHRFKVGDKFSPRVWSGTPYKSKQIIIAPDMEVKNIIPIHIWKSDRIMIGHKSGNETLGLLEAKKVCKNDGLEFQDFEDWFCKSSQFKRTNWFDGQIIIWNENINY